MGVLADPAKITDGITAQLNGRTVMGVKGPDPKVWGEDHARPGKVKGPDPVEHPQPTDEERMLRSLRDGDERMWTGEMTPTGLTADDLRAGRDHPPKSPKK